MSESGTEGIFAGYVHGSCPILTMVTIVISGMDCFVFLI